MTQPHRIIVPIDSQSADSWYHALACAEAICTSQTPHLTNVVLLIHTKLQLDHTSIADFLGASGVKLLDDGGALNLAFGATLRLATQQAIGTLPGSTVVIVFCADDALLEVVDGVQGLAGVVVVPEHEQSASQWRARWTPQIHDQAAKPPVRFIKDSIVENALKFVTGLINPGNGTLHPRDREHADEVLRILRAKGHTVKPQDIKSWAIQNGWTTGAAEDLEELATRLLGMKTKPRLSDIHNPDGKYDDWAK